jgi:6-pyruvoyltetrahydropterin/6-carboxytetrahydropterin synthase
MKLELRQQFRIESARFLPNLAKTHPCSRMHGHSFVVNLVLVGEMDPNLGWVRDYHEIDQLAGHILKELDHRVLNEIVGLENPTSENMAIWIYNQVRKHLPELKQVIVSETPTTECRYPVL